MVRFTWSTALVLASTGLAKRSTGSLAKVDPVLWSRLEEIPTVNAMVELRDSKFSSLESLEEDEASRVRNELIEATAYAAKDVESIFGGSMQRRRLEGIACPELDTIVPVHLWIAKRMHIPGLTRCVAEHLSQLDSVIYIRLEEVETIDSLTAAQAPPVDQLPELWAAEMIRAPDVWASGNTGEGIVIGSIDTGVRASHSLFASKIRTDYNWFDPINGTESPNDINGHGTHVMGLLVGDNGVGIAPGATWISCRGCIVTCDEATVLKCMEFMLCPTDPKGENAQCGKKPHVINNSWGGSLSKPVYQEAFNAWEKAGIIAVVSNGNAGPRCSTVGSPADYTNAIAVGMMTNGRYIQSRSSRGPAKNNPALIKPDISAPGYDVYSASSSGDSIYESRSGTSQAAPHVSGVIALMLAANPSLTPIQVRKAIITYVETATIDVVESSNCGDMNDLEFPNNNYGYGMTNATFAIDGVSGRVPTPEPPVSTPHSTSILTPEPTSLTTTTTTPVATPEPTTPPTQSPPPPSTSEPTLPPSLSSTPPTTWTSTPVPATSIPLPTTMPASKSTTSPKPSQCPAQCSACYWSFFNYCFNSSESTCQKFGGRWCGI